MPNVTHINGSAKAGRPQGVAAKRPIANRYKRAISPTERAEILAESKVRGCVQTAKERGITVGLCLEIRIEAMDKLLREAREWMARMERKAAA